MDCSGLVNKYPKIGLLRLAIEDLGGKLSDSWSLRTVLRPLQVGECQAVLADGQIFKIGELSDPHPHTLAVFAVGSTSPLTMPTPTRGSV